MNALVNDQVERLRKHLVTIPEYLWFLYRRHTRKLSKKLSNNKFIENCTREEHIATNFDGEDISSS